MSIFLQLQDVASIDPATWIYNELIYTWCIGLHSMIWRVMACSPNMSQQKSWLIPIAAEADPEGDQDAQPESAKKGPKDLGTSTKVSKAKGKAKSKATPGPKVSKPKVSEKKQPKKATKDKESRQTDYGKAKKSFSEKCLDEHYSWLYLLVCTVLENTKNRFATWFGADYLEFRQCKKSFTSLFLLSQGSYMKVLDAELP